VRRFWVVTALAALAAAVPGSPTAATRGVSAAYDNALIADKALSYVGKWGGDACRDARRSGLNGAGPYPVVPERDPGGTVTAPGDGQARAFVNCIVWLASNRTQWVGGKPDGTYFGAFSAAGGLEIKNINALEKGDIVQIDSGTYSFVIVKHLSGNSFTVVDSNSDLKETVLTYNRPVTLSSTERAFRMGHGFDAKSVTRAYAKAGLQLRNTGSHPFGPAQRVLDLRGANFSVLVFVSSTQATASLTAAVKSRLRARHTPWVQKANLLLLARGAIPGSGRSATRTWHKATAVLAALR
jgi:hypothetical protein